MSLTPKHAVSAEAIDAIDEESLDKEVRRSTYKRKRAVLFAVKLALFLLIWGAAPLKFYDASNPNKEIAALRFFAAPLIAYAVAAAVCAPFKIALTARRLHAVGSSVSRWFITWFFTVLSRLALWGILPLGVVALGFLEKDRTDYMELYLLFADRTVYWGLYLFYVLIAPLLTAYAYSKERALLRLRRRDCSRPDAGS